MISQIFQVSWSEWLASGFAILYLYFIAKNNVIGWFFGLVSCVFWAYAAFILYDLYLDGLLQLFYIGVSFFGIYQWQSGSLGNKPLPISNFSIFQNTVIIAFGLLLSVLLGYVFDNYTPSEATYIDALTTIFSIFATIMVVYKKLDNWIYWIFINTIYIYLYGSRGGLVFVGLFVVYLIMAINGYTSWKILYRQAKKLNIGL